MSYEKDLKHLKKEYKKSSEKLREAEICGHQADVDIWENDLVNISHQIYIHEQASKAEVYEAKAQAFDEIADVKSSLGICEDYTLEHSYDEDPVFEEMYYINQVVRFIRETIEQVEDDDQ